MLTSAFLHGGLFHLAGNLVFLLLFGSRVNAVIGNIATLMLYPLLAVGAGLIYLSASVAGPPTPADEAATWRPPICKTIATRGEGVPALLEAIQAHRTYLEETQTLSRRERARVEDELHDIVGHLLMRRLMDRVPPDELTGLVDRVAARELDPYSAAEALLQAQESFTEASADA